MPIKTFGSAVFGVNALTITIEVSIGGGNRYPIIGLPDNAIKESLRRIESAIQLAGLKMPRQRIVINLAPADICKEGSSYDLPIAIGILVPNMDRNICKINDSGQVLIKQAMEKIGLSARAYDRILKVSRTIADLDGSPEIELEHLAEAIHYRSLDRDSWAG